MKFPAAFLFLPLIASTLSCGSGIPRVLQSVTASPAIADAQDFPAGRVHFTATGIYNTAPKTVTPLPVTAWWANSPDVATVDQRGFAQCVPGGVGTVEIKVGTEVASPLWTVAQLTCP